MHKYGTEISKKNIKLEYVGWVCRNTVWRMVYRKWEIGICSVETHMGGEWYGGALVWACSSVSFLKLSSNSVILNHENNHYIK